MYFGPRLLCTFLYEYDSKFLPTASTSSRTTRTGCSLDKCMRTLVVFRLRMIGSSSNCCSVYVLVRMIPCTRTAVKLCARTVGRNNVCQGLSTRTYYVSSQQIIRKINSSSTSHDTAVNDQDGVPAAVLLIGRYDTAAVQTHIHFHNRTEAGAH